MELPPVPKTKGPAKLSWLNIHTSKELQEFSVQASIRIGFALRRLNFFGTNYVQNFKKQWFSPTLISWANQPLNHNQTVEEDKC